MNTAPLDLYWRDPAARMAATITPSLSHWRTPLETVPRHVFVPGWWGAAGSARTWVAFDGPSDPDHWLSAAYSDETLVTRVGKEHADAAARGKVVVDGRPTSASINPDVLIQLYRYARLTQGHNVLEIGTGPGYGTALLCARLGDTHVTSVEIDRDVTKTAKAHLEEIGMHPTVRTMNALRFIPAGTFDRIISTVGVATIPAPWMYALREGGRLVTPLADTCAVLTADKHPGGRLYGRVEWEPASLMTARHTDDYVPELSDDRLYEILTAPGDRAISPGRYPLVDPAAAWDLFSTLTITHPELQYYWDEPKDHASATCTLWDANGSWARAAGIPGQIPTVFSSGPTDLWAQLEDLKTQWLTHGPLPLFGAPAVIEEDGTVRITPAIERDLHE